MRLAQEWLRQERPARRYESRLHPGAFMSAALFFFSPCIARRHTQSGDAEGEGSREAPLLPRTPRHPEGSGVGTERDMLAIAVLQRITRSRGSLWLCLLTAASLRAAEPRCAGASIQRGRRRFAARRVARTPLTSRARFRADDDSHPSSQRSSDYLLSLHQAGCRRAPRPKPYGH